jgi:hypothetical protein
VGQAELRRAEREEQWLLRRFGADLHWRMCGSSGGAVGGGLRRGNLAERHRGVEANRISIFDLGARTKFEFRGTEGH